MRWLILPVEVNILASDLGATQTNGKNINLTPVFLEERAGDIKLSLASIKKTAELIGYHS